MIFPGISSSISPGFPYVISTWALIGILPVFFPESPPDIPPGILTGFFQEFIQKFLQGLL